MLKIYVDNLEETEGRMITIIEANKKGYHPKGIEETYSDIRKLYIDLGGDPVKYPERLK